MPQTTTAINACDAAIWLDNAAGTLIDISGSSNSINMDFDNELGMLRNFGSRWPIRLECGKDATFALTAVYTEAATEAVNILKNWFFNTPGNRTLKVYLPDKNVGSDVYSGEFRLEKLSIPAESGKADPIMVSATLRPNGAVTLTTNAT
jgi:hypothetical protein